MDSWTFGNDDTVKVRVHSRDKASNQLHAQAWDSN